ncbi:MAG: hypothetical protein ACRD0P_06110 [Stackebrandtia sp.]
MSRNKEITGGDLESLWMVANRHLPMIQNVYNRQIYQIDEAESGQVGDLGPFLERSLSTYRKFLLQTAESLETTADHVGEAINAYKYVDGSNASQLTEAGKDLEENVSDKDVVEVIDLERETPPPPTGDPEGVEITTPIGSMGIGVVES